MADTANKKTNYISRVIAGTNALLDAMENLEKLTQEGQALGYVAQGSSAAPGSLTDADFVGTNSMLAAADFAGIMATLQQLDQQAHANNAAMIASLYRVRQ